MTHRPACWCLAFLVSGLVACGGEEGDRRGAPPREPAATDSLPKLASSAAKAGERLFTGQSSPRTHGPFELDGTYLVRFEQFAPEDPSLDFSQQTPFAATLQRRRGDDRGAVKLFSAADESGRRKLTIRGRYVLDVSFGDFPYALRFTPRR